MTVFVAIRDLEGQAAELTEKIEAGETVVVTKDGLPVFDLAPHKGVDQAYKEGLANLEKGWAYLRERGITNPVPFIADDFDDPLPEDFLLRPLPPD